MSESTQLSASEKQAQLMEQLNEMVECSQQLLHHYVQQMQGESFSIPDRGVVAKAFMQLAERMLTEPDKIAQAQSGYMQGMLSLYQSVAKRMQGEDVVPVVEPEPGDKRFKDDIWRENPYFDFLKQSYLLASQSILDTVRGIESLDPKTAEKVDFYTRQYIEALAPTNFAISNPQVIKATLDSGGENLRKGFAQMLQDLERGKGELRIKMTDLDAFELGKNIAVTPGKVVFQTPLMQLLQYSPSTETVFARPLLIVPPWINKFYILDLKPKNSFIKWAVDQGFTVFVISWINPDESLAERDFEDYLLEGTLAALDAIEQATGESAVNAIGYCLGGTLLMCTLAYLAATGNAQRIKSATFFTTLVDFSEVGELSVFVDEEQIELMEKQMEKKGYLEGSQMATVFNMLRPNDLIWSFYVNNYLLGRDPMAFDLLYWNSDSTRMPRVMHSFYLRNMYLHNRLRDPGGIDLVGEPIDLAKVKTPLYFLSTKDDHIAPWKGTYKGALLTKGPVKFVLGGSGHIAGVVNPAGSHKYGYWTNTKKPSDADEWLAGAQQHEGSWWPDWFAWVKPKAGKQVPARVPGDGALKPLEDAPGSYVKVRLDQQLTTE